MTSRTHARTHAPSRADADDVTHSAAAGADDVTAPLRRRRQHNPHAARRQPHQRVRGAAGTLLFFYYCTYYFFYYCSCYFFYYCARLHFSTTFPTMIFLRRLAGPALTDPAGVPRPRRNNRAAQLHTTHHCARAPNPPGLPRHHEYRRVSAGRQRLRAGRHMAYVSVGRLSRILVVL